MDRPVRGQHRENISGPWRPPVHAVLHPRAAEEWQGMLVDISTPQICDAGFCGLGLACKGGRCLACDADHDCPGDESCVLDHCIARNSVGCTTRRDCAEDELCTLSGYDESRRGNATMRSECLGDGPGYIHLEKLEDRTNDATHDDSLHSHPTRPMHSGL